MWIANAVRVPVVKVEEEQLAYYYRVQENVTNCSKSALMVAIILRAKVGAQSMLGYIKPKER